ncbi:MAG: hypothetical protein MHMPM18_001462 [Marteilia pararefringens]
MSSFLESKRCPEDDLDRDNMMIGAKSTNLHSTLNVKEQENTKDSLKNREILKINRPSSSSSKKVTDPDSYKNAFQSVSLSSAFNNNQDEIIDLSAQKNNPPQKLMFSDIFAAKKSTQAVENAKHAPQDLENAKNFPQNIDDPINFPQYVEAVKNATKSVKTTKRSHQELQTAKGSPIISKIQAPQISQHPKQSKLHNQDIIKEPEIEPDNSASNTKEQKIESLNLQFIDRINNVINTQSDLILLPIFDEYRQFIDEIMKEDK